MKKFSAVVLATALAFFVSCGKQQTEAEKNAEIERRVQQRLAAERQADEQQKLAQREADLQAREEALEQKQQEQESASVPTATPEMRGGDVQQREVTEGAQLPEADDDEPASYNTFYTKLEPYGEWRETSDYGYVWQPNESSRSRNWRPYTRGRWVYTDAGWTWDSNEPFGWATYHYGRWTKLRGIGWVWVPGDQWAPAWVSWRTSDDYVGWAPLPPEARFERGRGIHNWADSSYDIGPDQYCFVPATELGVQQIAQTIVPVERNVTIVNQTTNVTDITYNNTTIVNQGPNFEELRRRGRHPIPQLRLERRQRFQKANPHAVIRGDVIEMPAPAIAPARPVDRPRAVREKLAKPVVDRGWDNVRDKKAAEQARAKMKADAKTPAATPSAKPAASQTPQPNESARPVETRRATPSAKPAVSQTPPPNEAVQPSETPVRNFPDRAKTKPRAVSAMSPGIKATPAPTASPARQQTEDAMRQKKEAARAQQEKLRAEKKAVQQEMLEERRNAKREKITSPSPQPAATPPSEASDPTKSTATAPPPKSVRTTPSQSPPRESKKADKDKKQTKRDRKSPKPSPSASVR